MTGFVEPVPSSRGHSSDHIDRMGVREMLLMIVRGTRSLLGGLGYLCVQGALTIHLAFDAGHVLVSATLLGRFRALGFVLARCSTDSLRLRRVEWGFTSSLVCWPP